MAKLEQVKRLPWKEKEVKEALYLGRRLVIEREREREGRRCLRKILVWVKVPK